MVRRYRSAPVVALALVAAGGGIWLSTSARSFDAGEDATGVHIDGMNLASVPSPAAGVEVFTGDATLAIVGTSSTLRAGAVMTWNGYPATGRCAFGHSSSDISETCEFDIAADRLTSTDSFNPRTRTWRRRYSDGVEIAISVPGGRTVIPVPFPLGR
jgi:hypothetical protein